MKKRILSLALAFLFVFALTAPASAIIDVYGDVDVIFPVFKEGREFPAASSFICSRGTPMSVTWAHANWSSINPGEKVGADGYQFILKIGLEEGYDWLSTVNATVYTANGKPVSLNNVAADSGILEIAGYVEAEAKKPEMDYVEILAPEGWGVKPGKSPVYNDFLITNGKNGYGVRWYDAGTNKEMTGGDTFAAGHRYEAVFYINPDNGTEWKAKNDTYADVTAVFIPSDGSAQITAANPQFSYESTGTKLIASFTFDCAAPAPAAKEINFVSVEATDGFWYPVHGRKPKDDSVFKILTEGCSKLMADWYDKNGKMMTGDDKFTGGEPYTLRINLYLDSSDNYVWASADKIQVMLEDGGGNGWINQKPVNVILTDWGMDAVVEFTFTAVKETLPEKLIVKNIHAPVEGKPLDFTAEVIGCSAFEVTWSESNMDLGWYETSDAPIAEKGHVYSVRIRIWPPAGTEFPFRDTDISQGWLDMPFEMYLSDGTKAEGAKAAYGGIGGVHPAESCVIGYTFPPVGQDKPDKPQVLFMNEPEDLTVAEGQTAVFSAAVMGSPKAYQWYEAKPGGAFLKLTDSADVTGSNTYQLTLKNVKAYMNGYSYRCVAADEYGLEITSKAAVLTVKKAAGEPASIVFSDVKESDWFYSWVYDAVKLGLINGKGKKDGKDYFDPAGNITFAETAKLAACMHQKYTAGTVTLSNGDPWYKPYADYCAENGILKKDASGGGISVGDVMTRANEAVTRAEFAWIFAHALPKGALPGINEIPDDTVPDVKHSGLAKEFWSFREEAYEEIYTLYRAGIVNGSDSRGTFNPTSTIKRSEVAAIAVRMMEPAKRVGPPKELGS
ncbi:MAG: S-layer homology domain-containing protein [Clostridia bacterium]|nr:S-layer homology domain-containing protein [Clostridia bacterium]